MKRVLLTESSVAFEFTAYALCCFMACYNLVEQWKKSAVVKIRVSYEDRFPHCIKIGEDSSDNRKHFFAIAGVSAIYEKDFIIASDYRCIAAARRLDYDDLGVIRDFMMTDARLECFPS